MLAVIEQLLALCRWTVLPVSLAMTGLALAQAPATTSGQAGLKAAYMALGEQLRGNPFGRPLVIESAESSDALRGDVYAVVDHSFAVVRSALDRPEEWCEVLILHLNTKYCRASGAASAPAVTLAVGKKFDQPLKDAYRVEFAWKTVAASPDYLEIRLDAPDGPLGTHDYRIALRATAIDGGHSFVHLHYAYGYGMAGRVAMKAYLATVGRDKVGFTPVPDGKGGRDGLIAGVRGVVERNTMRYYLAIDAYLDSLSAPPAQQLERRLDGWFAATELYARQLHELDRDQYLRMKRSEYQRQRTAS